MTGRWHPLASGSAHDSAVEWGQDEFGVFQTFQVRRVKFRMRWIPAGKFLMGSPVAEVGRYDEEGPQREVTLTRGFWMGETPCTQELWQAVMGNNPSRFKNPTHPVETVRWEDCQDFCARLNEQIPAFGARLPTEAEWEYACRAGTTTATWAGDLKKGEEGTAPMLDPIAWYWGNSNLGGKRSTQPVGLKLPNPLGLFDMLGNVLEWCSDRYGPYDPRALRDPTGAPAGTRRVLRGGSWYGGARFVRAAYRNAYDPALEFESVGFRLVRGQPSRPRSSTE
ncbi:MAG: formylglycine-generating enzyme family protein [Polyangiaceae bacterium]|nr:formylglycine-generating enzyme family protein [Polyangiaceae bacterium]